MYNLLFVLSPIAKCTLYLMLFYVLYSLPQNEERGSPKWDPVDLSRIGGTVATACCQALTKHLNSLKEAGLDRIGLRVSLGNDNVRAAFTLV